MDRLPNNEAHMASFMFIFRGGNAALLLARNPAEEAVLARKLAACGVT